MKKLLCLFVAMLMIMATLVACGGNGDETTPPVVDNDEQGTVDPITLNIVVRASADGENVYESGANGYEYTLADRTVLTILEDFMLIEYDVVIEYDENGKLVKVGDIEASATQLWGFSQASAPKGVAEVEPVDGNIDEYKKVNDGDTLVIYLM